MIELPLGILRIEGKDVPFTVKVYDNRRAQVYLPAEYPRTTFRQMVGLKWAIAKAHVHVSVTSLEDLLRGKRVNRPRMAEMFGPHAFTDPTPREMVYLKTISGPIAWEDDMTPSERRALRGIARRALCVLMRLVASEFTPQQLRGAILRLGANGSVPVRGGSWNRASLMRDVDNVNNRRRLRNMDDAAIRGAERIASQRALEAMYTRSLGVAAVYRQMTTSMMMGWFSNALLKCRH